MRVPTLWSYSEDMAYAHHNMYFNILIYFVTVVALVLRQVQHHVLDQNIVGALNAFDCGVVQPQASQLFCMLAHINHRKQYIKQEIPASITLTRYRFGQCW